MRSLNYYAGEIGRRLVRWSQRDSNCLRHARDEWAIVFPEKDEMQDAIRENVLDVVAMFALAGHSGFSASYTRRYIDAALAFEPLGPLTGVESEWGEPFCNDSTQQNRRCSHVFRDSDGRAYDIEGRVFRDPSGACYTSKDSRVYVEFPYIPKTEYVDVPD